MLRALSSRVTALERSARFTPTRQALTTDTVQDAPSKPTAKYQVYTPIDDTLEPTWTHLHVQQ